MLWGGRPFVSCLAHLVILRIHQTLKLTPAMAAGATSRLFSSIALEHLIVARATTACGCGTVRVDRRGGARNDGLSMWGAPRDCNFRRWTSSHRHHEETGEFRSIQVFDFVKHAPDHDTVLKRYETSLDAMATTRRPYTR